MNETKRVCVDMHYLDYAGTSTVYTANIFMDNIYLNSLIFSLGSNNKEKDAFPILNMIERAILEPCVLNTTYSYKMKSGDENKQNLKFEFDFSKSKKTAYDLLKAKFSEVSNDNYYKVYSIREINKNHIDSWCWDAIHLDSHSFDSKMIEQGKALISYIKDKFGVVIKITKYPTYKNMKTSLGSASISFPYEIISVSSMKKLTPNSDIEDKDLENLIDNAILKFNSTYDDKDEKEIIDKNINCNLYIATDRMFRNPSYLHVIKRNEKELLEDFDNYKKLLLNELHGESTFHNMNSRMLYNFKKLMPKLYNKMFNDLPYGLIPTIIYRGLKKQNELDDVAYKFITPKISN